MQMRIGRQKDDANSYDIQLMVQNPAPLDVVNIFLRFFHASPLIHSPTTLSRELASGPPAGRLGSSEFSAILFKYILVV